MNSPAGRDLKISGIRLRGLVAAIALICLGAAVLGMLVASSGSSLFPELLNQGLYFSNLSADCATTAAKFLGTDIMRQGGSLDILLDDGTSQQLPEMVRI